MEWTYKKPGDTNAFSKLGELTVRIMRLVAHEQLSRAEAQLRANNIVINLTKKELPKKELAQEFPHLMIKELMADF